MNTQVTPPDLNELRRRILSGGSYTREELAAAIAALRVNRVAAVEKAATSRKAKTTATSGISDSDLDADLRALGLDI